MLAFLPGDIFLAKKLPTARNTVQGLGITGHVTGGNLGFLICSDKNIGSVRPSYVSAEAPPNNLTLHIGVWPVWGTRLAFPGFCLGVSCFWDPR